MAKHKKPRQDLSGSDSTLSHNPFAALQAQPPPSPRPAPRQNIKDSHATAGPEKRTEEQEKEGGPGFKVRRTRKGGWPLQLENRAANKVVTCLSLVSGDVVKLLKQAKKHCGTGGTLHLDDNQQADGIELQGDQRARLVAFLENLSM